MVRRVLLVAIVSLLAVTGSDVVAMCASNLIAEANCCCPVEGPPPCFDTNDASDATMPDSDAVVDTAPTLQAASLPAAVAPWPSTARQVAVGPSDAPAFAAPSVRLLGCVWLC